jgi:hypothetical protein
MADLATPVILANGVELHDYGVGSDDPIAVVGDVINLAALDTTGWDGATYEILTRPSGSGSVLPSIGFVADPFAVDAAGVWSFRLTAVGQNRRKSATAYIVVCEVTTNLRIKKVPDGLALRDERAFLRDRINELAEALDIGGGGSGGGAFSGDASSIRTVPVDPTLPTVSGSVPRFDATLDRYVSRRLTQDDILSGFWISSFTRPAGSLVEIGTTVAAPSFTAAYSALPPASAILTDSDGTAPRTVTSTPTAFASLGSFTKIVSGQSVTFTLTAVKDSVTATLNFGLVFGMRRFFGASAASSGFDWAFARSLTSSEIATSKARGTTSYTLAAGQRWVVAWAKAWGTPAWVVNGYPATPDLLADNVEPPAWQGSHAYVAGEWVQNAGNAYRCQTSGTSASSGGPSGTGLAIADGTTVWNASGTAASVRLTIYALSDFATGASTAPWSAS